LILSKASVASPAGVRPPAAVEVSPEGVLVAASAKPGHAPSYAFAPLPRGALMPGIAEANIHATEVVANAIKTALGEVSPRTRSVTLVLPDACVRVFMLDFDSFPAKAGEALAVLRFRLRKMLPFDVEQAGVGYQVLSQDKTQVKVLTAVLPGTVLSEYEAAVRTAGYEPGAVLPASLAALETVDSMKAVLAANLGALTLTTLIVSGQDLLLYRTLDLPEDPEQRRGEIQRGIAVASAYYEDKLGLRASDLHYAGNTESGTFAGWIADPELTVVDLAPRPDTGALTPLGNASIASVAGALAGAR
jgi:type IV pilus assembly protein PilM